MKKVLFLAFVIFAISANAQEIPKAPNPPRLVNDFAHALTPDQVASLESKLVAYDDSSSVQIAVVTVETTGDYAIEDYALKILRTWGVGNKKTNNGLVILAAIKDHKVFIATGYGMEGSVPDITAKEIVENEIVPNFKENNYYRGFDQAADAVIKAVNGEYKAPEGYNKRGRSGKPGGSIFGIIIFFLILFFIISRGGRGGGGGLMSRSGVLPFILGSMLGSGSRGGGGWSGGGDWGGGGGGGGGFGGFGGGSGGGGGAGGSW
jgi:uncharacterized protein